MLFIEEDIHLEAPKTSKNPRGVTYIPCFRRLVVWVRSAQDIKPKIPTLGLLVFHCAFDVFLEQKVYLAEGCL